MVTTKRKKKKTAGFKGLYPPCRQKGYRVLYVTARSMREEVISAEPQAGLHDMQRLVGGYIEAMMPHAAGVSDLIVYCDEAGRRQKMPHPSALFSDFMGVGVVYGDYIVARVADNGDLQSLTDADVKKVRSILKES